MTAIADNLVAHMRAMGSEENLAGMARFGIVTDRSFGAKSSDIKELAKKHRGNQALALELWSTGFREARLLAAFIADPKAFTPKQMDAWINDCDSWDICDGTANQLFRRSPHAYAKALEWSAADRLFTRRAGFALMAGLALKSSRLDDDAYEPFLERISAAADDGRPLVRKAVNWALRQIGKRDAALNKRAISIAMVMRDQGSASARWIAGDALRELRSVKVRAKLKVTEPIV